MDLLSARRESHQTRNGVTYDIRFGDDGVVVEPNDAFNNMMGGMTAPEQTGEDLFGFTGSDVVDTAKAAGRAVAGGVQDAVTGVVGLADDIGTAIDDKLGGGLGFIDLNNGFNYTRSKPENAIRLDEAFDAGLQELGVKVPQGDSPVEAMARGLVQFGAGMTIAPIRGAGYVNTMLRGGFADALFDPEEGNLSTLLKEFGLDGAVLDFLDSEVDDEASAEQRLTARLKQTIEGAGISLPIDFIVQGFKALRSEEGASEIIRNKLSTVKDRLTQPGEMPTVGSNLGNIADLRKQANIQRFGYDPDDPVANVKAPTEKEPGIIAFHGSGADFNEFRLDMVNTGEGAQAYGYGLYFTDSEDIANFYRQSVGGGTGLENFAIGDLELVRSGEFRDYSPGATPFGRDRRYRRVQDLTAKDYAQASLIEDIFVNEWRLFNEIKTSGAGSRYEPKKGTELKNELLSIMNDTLKSKDPIDQPGEVEYLTNLINSVASNEKQIKFDTVEYGKTYQVALEPKPDELVDYDLSLNEQSENIRKALQPFYEKYGVANTADFGTLLESVKSMRTIPDDAFSEELVKQGIKGVKYRAAGSRGANVTDEAAKLNYVIFDDKLISIMKKYGIVGPVAVTAKSVASNNDEQEGI